MGYLNIYLIVLAAVFAGWLLGRLTSSQNSANPKKATDSFGDYFVGLNYLLNDEPDEAIDTFIKGIEINSDTIETHLALGALLRRRGKVDKAIKVHQALLGRPALGRHFADSTRLQLSRDYIAAGLLDRAERLLQEILIENANANAKWDALSLLITIYQTEKEWEKAIDCAKRLLVNEQYKKDKELRAAASHYCCELSELCLSEDKASKAREQITRAFIFDRGNVRASLLLAQIERRLGNYKPAIKELVRIRTNNPEFISQVLGPLAECYAELENMSEYEKLLTNTLHDEPNISVVLALLEMVKSRSGDEAAIEFLNEYLTKKPSLIGLVELLRLQIPNAETVISSNLNLLQQMINKLLRKRAAYQCNHCGYESRSLYWLCPSCQKWDKIKPILEADSV